LAVELEIEVEQPVFGDGCIEFGAGLFELGVGGLVFDSGEYEFVVVPFDCGVK